ncbi:MAG: rRNA pseudouridine synthase [Oscillospiraceae bacterium]|nr:rRNA pseudouridine synthase [Oscillospiraceae bacterium]
MAESRIDKFLADRTPHSRSEIKILLRNGAVRADGIVVTDPKCKINPDQQEITLNGKKIHCGENFYLILNKPENYICSTEDRQHKTVLELIPEELRHKDMFPAGRLDIDSTGLVLMTTDGMFAHQMLSPRHHVPKYYLVRLAKPVRKEIFSLFAEGITLSDGLQCLPAQVQALEKNYCLICLHEGKYHQVKRMFAAVGNHVEHLHRVAMGGLLLPSNLPSGSCLEIFNKEISELLKPKAFPEMCEQIVTDFSSYLINERQ